MNDPPIPPIPPLCAYFDLDPMLHHRFRAGAYSKPVEISVLIDDGDPPTAHYWRGIIGSVARCAWLDEKKIAPWENPEICDANIEAWREWGNQ